MYLNHASHVSVAIVMALFFLSGVQSEDFLGGFTYHGSIAHTHPEREDTCKPAAAESFELFYRARNYSDITRLRDFDRRFTGIMYS